MKNNLEKPKGYSVLKDTASYAGATWIIQNISFLLAIFIRRILGPEAMGIWILLQVFLNYAAYGNLGMLNAVCREIPILEGRGGEKEKIERIKNAGYTYIMIVAVLTSLLIVLGVFIWKAKLSNDLFYGFLTIAAVNLLQRLNNYSIQISHVEKKFIFISKFKIYSALVNALLVIILSWTYHLYGFYMATILSYVFNIIYLDWIGNLRFKIVSAKKEIIDLIKFGAPFIVLSFVVTVLNSIDKISIGKFLGLEALGIYSIAILAGSYIFMLPNVFQIVLYPRTLEKFGNSTDIEGKMTYSTVPGKIMSLYFALCIGLIWLTAPTFCKMFPKEWREYLCDLSRHTGT